MKPSRQSFSKSFYPTHFIEATELLAGQEACGFLRRHVNGRGSTGLALTTLSERRIV